MWGSEDTFRESIPGLPLCEFPRSNSGIQAWQQTISQLNHLNRPLAISLATTPTTCHGILQTSSLINGLGEWFPNRLGLTFGPACG